MHSGVMVSGDDLTVKQQADFLVDGALIAAGDLTLETAGTITNNAAVSGAQVQALADVVSIRGYCTDQWPLQPMWCKTKILWRILASLLMQIRFIMKEPIVT